jgi:hypothetical protein
MNTIDLDAIINSNPMTAILSVVHKDRIKMLIADGIHQALVLASENAKVTAYDYEPDQRHYVDKQSILDTEKLIK